MTRLLPFLLVMFAVVLIVSCDRQGAPAVGSAVVVDRIGVSEVDAAALTIDGDYGQAINGKAFQQDALLSHRGWQYLAYYDAARRVCLARRKLPDGTWQVLRFEDYDFTSNDAHNTISLGISALDGTIHLAFDHHGDPLHYRVSRPGVASDPESVEWEPSLFGPVTSELEEGRPISITYPRFVPTPDGGLQFCYRQGGSGNGDRMLVDYDPGRGIWTGTRMIDSGAGWFEDEGGVSDSRCSYPNGYDYGPRGRLHVTLVWRESSQGANHDLAYVFSEDGGRTWLNNRGEPLSGPPRVDSPGITVVEIGRGLGLMNTHGQAVDSEGRIHTVMWHCTERSLAAVGSAPGRERWGPAEARRYHHYWRDLEGEWHHRELPGASGNRPKLFIDPADNAVLIYGSQDGPASDLRIAVATAAADWTDWRIVHTEPGPFVNEMLGDRIRWAEEGILSVMVQDTPPEPHQPTRLQVIDLTVRVPQD
ncbi:MAG: BNR repeat-containing protein [Gemmatimonadales bacterium]